MLAILKTVLAGAGALFGSKAAKQFLANRGKAQSGVFDQEKELAKQMRGSWKDEFLTLVFTAPIWTNWIGLWWNCFTGYHPNGIGQGIIDASVAMFDVINNMSDDYRMIMLLIVSASFGVHVTRVQQKKKLAEAITEVAKAKPKRSTRSTKKTVSSRN